MTANPYEYLDVIESIEPQGAVQPPPGLDPQLAGFFASVAINSPLGGVAMALRAGSLAALPGGLLVGLVCGLIASAITFPIVGVVCRRFDSDGGTAMICAVGSALTNGGLWFVLLSILELAGVRTLGGGLVALVSAGVTLMAVLHRQTRIVTQTKDDHYLH